MPLTASAVIALARVRPVYPSRLASLFAAAIALFVLVGYPALRQFSKHDSRKDGLITLLQRILASHALAASGRLQELP
jgi:hypothetical protein